MPQRLKIQILATYPQHGVLRITSTTSVVVDEHSMLPFDTWRTLARALAIQEQDPHADFSKGLSGGPLGDQVKLYRVEPFGELEGNCLARDIALQHNEYVVAVPATLSMADAQTIIEMVVNASMEQSKSEKESRFADLVAANVLRRMAKGTRLRADIINNLVFIAMPMNGSDPLLPDVHSSIVSCCRELNLQAKRVDDVQTNDRITHTITNLIEQAAFVVVDLTHSRPNVFFEAGYAEGVGKTPVYVAREGTTLEFDVKDYPVIFFKNATELSRLLGSRLKALVDARSGQSRS